MSPMAAPDKNLNPFLILVGLAIVLNFILPIGVIIQVPYTYLGLFFILFGISINLWCEVLFHKRKTTVNPSGSPCSLIVSGPFRISRNPIYLGMTLILLGIAIFLGTLVTFLLPLVFWAIMETMFIPTEEKNLEKAFGKEYEDYKRKVRRWI